VEVTTPEFTVRESENFNLQICLWHLQQLIAMSLAVWDRRSFGSARNKPEGMFIGHTEGVTYLSSKGDGVYFLSNSKDQTLKLWDVRKAAEFSDSAYRAPGFSARGQWDYRMSFYPGTPGQTKLAADNSTVTCVGHHTLSTLIRCGFSPFMQNGSRYLYCGSFDGSVCIYDLAGNMVQRYVR
jgi:WD repeat-containing protein 23